MLPSGAIGLTFPDFPHRVAPALTWVGLSPNAEAFELTRAVNAGTGFACTVHTNIGFCDTELAVAA